MFRLRELEKKDLPIINKWRNNPELIQYLGSPFRFININVDEKWFDSYMQSRSSSVRCSIVDDKDECLGLVSLVSIDSINQSAEFHIMIGDSNNQGKGIGTFATKEMLKHAFLNLNLRRIELNVLESNIRAQALYKKVGFIHEGTKRSAKYKNGIFENILIFSILKDDFTF